MKGVLYMKFPIIAQRINEAINLKNITPQELANRSGVAKASISQYRNGTNKPSNISASKISEVLNCNPLWLMGYDIDNELKQNEESINNTELEIIKAYRSSDSLTQAMVQRTLGIEDKIKVIL